MGNDQSQLRGLEIDQQSVETTDFWSLYSGQLANGEQINKNISVFQGEPVVKGQLWANQGPLDRASKNFMIYRHPSILKFISSWERGSQKFLATEQCVPLSSELERQSNVQICLGLRNILCSLIFLIEQGNARHLNICSSSIYVTTENGAWRVAGFEHLWKSKELTAILLERSQPFRYKNAIDPMELKQNGQNLEQYSFAVLCEEILKNQSQDAMPHVSDFKQYCSTHLKHKNVSMRPKLSAVLLHPYFNHEFVIIHSFLMELPLKNLQEKQMFFKTLVDRLRAFNEENVAIQMADLLLSRMVLLDETAKQFVTPFVLIARTAVPINSQIELSITNTSQPIQLLIPGTSIQTTTTTDGDATFGLFNSQTFSKYIVPKILKIFNVRDSQIRLILLEYFSNYMKYIDMDDLKDLLLPQLLLGIKDTNDILVSETLRCLADLVPILGAAIVVGRNRGRLFADGRPNQGMPSENNISKPNWIEHRSITPVINSGGGEFLTSSGGSPLLDHVDLSASYDDADQSGGGGGGGVGGDIDGTPRKQQHLNMPVRLSPDGGEDIKNGCEVLELEDDAWSDWEADVITGDENESQIFDNNIKKIIDIDDGDVLINSSGLQQTQPLLNHSISVTKSNVSSNSTGFSGANDDLIIKDIKEMDIKTNLTEEIDFFKDMEPIIVKTNIHVIASTNSIENSTKNSSQQDNFNNNINNKNNNTNTMIDVNVDQSRFEIKLNDTKNGDGLNNGSGGGGGDDDDEGNFGGGNGWDDQINDWDDDDEVDVTRLS